MKRKQVALVAAGLVISAALAFINIYIGGIAFIIVIAVLMSMQISQDTRSLADVGVTLHEDAKGISVINRGNVPAVNIHVSLVPLDKEFDVSRLETDKSVDFPLDHMIVEAKAVVSFEAGRGSKFQKTYQLSSLGRGDDDILKPMFPLFRQD